MIVRRLSDLASDREVATPNWTSRRLLLRSDGMGFSLHDTVIRAGTRNHMHYKHHLEAVYCLEGAGTLEDLRTGEQIPIGPGTLYALDQHDEHVLTARSDMRFLCVFNPALVGPEVHAADRAYPLLADDGSDITPRPAPPAR